MSLSLGRLRRLDATPRPPGAPGPGLAHGLLPPVASRVATRGRRQTPRTAGPGGLCHLHVPARRLPSHAVLPPWLWLACLLRFPWLFRRQRHGARARHRSSPTPRRWPLPGHAARRRLRPAHRHLPPSSHPRQVAAPGTADRRLTSGHHGCRPRLARLSVRRRLQPPRGGQPRASWSTRSPQDGARPRALSCAATALTPACFHIYR